MQLKRPDVHRLSPVRIRRIGATRVAHSALVYRQRLNRNRVTVEVKRVRRTIRIAACLNSRTRRQQRVRLRRAAVVSQRSKSGARNANLVAVDAVCQTSGAAGADQVERAGRIDGATDVVSSIRRAVFVEVAGDDRVLKRNGACLYTNTAATAKRVVVGVGGVIGDRGVDDGYSSAQSNVAIPHYRPPCYR